MLETAQIECLDAEEDSKSIAEDSPTSIQQPTLELANIASVCIEPVVPPSEGTYNTAARPEGLEIEHGSTVKALETAEDELKQARNQTKTFTNANREFSRDLAAVKNDLTKSTQAQEQIQ